jgi:hypothetical protein
LVLKIVLKMSIVPAITSMLEEYLADADLKKVPPELLSPFH